MEEMVFPGQKYVLQAERLACANAIGTGDFLPVFRSLCEVHLEQEK
jgi:hypothetical protein